jgi:hypothetical protein
MMIIFPSVFFFSELNFLRLFPKEKGEVNHTFICHYSRFTTQLMRAARDKLRVVASVALLNYR